MSKPKLNPLKVTFEMDIAGAIYDPFVPPTLDGIIDWCLSPMVRQSKSAPTRGGEPEEIRLPFGTWRVGKHWGWCASALQPLDDETVMTSIRYWRKRFRENKISMVNGVINTQAGAMRDYNLPFEVQHPTSLTAYCVADRHTIHDLLRRNLKYIAKKKHRGMGLVTDFSVEIIADDYSLMCDGKAMRWLPTAEGLREVRLRPPYWNNNERVACCEVGDEYHGAISQP
jgi:CRISPR type IV-associated protein Csf3